MSTTLSTPVGLFTRLGLNRYVRDVWAVGDQALIAASNFATMILVAQALGVELFGRFTLVYSALLFANIFQVALITQPHNVLGTAREGDDYRRYTTSTLFVQFFLIALEVALATGAAVTAFYNHWPALYLLISLIPAIVGWQLQEFVRRVMYTEGRYFDVFWNDALSYGGQSRSTHPAHWLDGALEGLLLPEQGFCFLDFGQILFHVEINKNWCEHLGNCRGSPICAVEARKSNCTAQLESLRLLGAGDFQGRAVGVFGHGNVRRVKTQRELSLAAMKFGIEPMLAGLFRPGDQPPQDFQPGLSVPGLRIRHRNLHPPKWFAEVAVILVKQCPAPPHFRKPTHPVAGAPPCQAVQIAAGGDIQRHRMFAREGESQNSLCFLQHAPA